MSNRKVIDENHTPLPVDPHTGRTALLSDLLERADGRVQYCWPWPFKDQHTIEATAEVAGVPSDDALMHETVHLLRRHALKRHIVKVNDLPAKACPKKGIAAILKAVTALIDAHGHLSPEEIAIISDGGIDGGLATAVKAAAAVERRLMQQDFAEALPPSRVGPPRKARSVLIGQLDRAYSRHRGDGAKRRIPFVGCCLTAIGEPAEPGAIKEAIRRERKAIQAERQRMNGHITPVIST